MQKRKIVTISIRLLQKFIPIQSDIYKLFSHISNPEDALLASKRRLIDLQ